MDVDREYLIDALEKVRPGLSKREMVEQSTSFAFMDGHVTTYNDEISVSHPVPDLEGINGVVEAEPLYNLLKKMDAAKIKLRLAESKIKVSGGRSRANLTLHGEVRMPLEEIDEPAGWYELTDANSFMDALRFAHLSCSRDMTRPILTCVHLTSEGCIESSDNYRITRLVVDDAPETNCLIPASSIRSLLQYDVTYMGVGNGWAHFSTSDETVFSCRMHRGEFPDVESLLDVRGDDLDLSGLDQTAIDRSMIFAARDRELDEEIRVTIGDGKLKVSSSAEFGDYRESLEFGDAGPNASFAINPSLLKDILGRSTAARIGDGKLKFEGDNWEHVIALRMEG